MRISDWSSDVCSSDLAQQGVVRLEVVGGREERLVGGDQRQIVGVGERQQARLDGRLHRQPVALQLDVEPAREDRREALQHLRGGARKSVVWGKSVSVRVARGGRRPIKKKKKTK